MSADTAPLHKVDSAVEEGGTLDDTKPKHRRKSSSAPGVHNILDLGKFRRPSSNQRTQRSQPTAEKEGAELQIAPETQKLNW